MSTATITSSISRQSTESLLATSPLLSAPIVTAPELKLKIDDRWYDLTKWQHQHPGGTAILTHMNGLDATDAFYALHSEEAVARLKKLHSTPSQKEDDVSNPPDQVTKNFRKLRQELEQEGWFKRNLYWELWNQFQVYGLAIAGTLLAKSGYTLSGILLLAFSLQQSGWVGHDHAHGRGRLQYILGRIMAGMISAFSMTWWNGKHNNHHIYTNHLGLDIDIENDPVFHLFFPSPDKDVWYRKFQHLYFPFAASLLYVSWRVQSLQYAFKTGNVSELVSFIPSYLWMFYLGFTVSFWSVILAGFFVAIVVTVTHQSEDMLDTNNELAQYQFTETQFRTTRDAHTSNIFMNWFWGGMQFQLEHHLFPFMPRYYYQSLVPRIQKFAKENNLEYRADDVIGVWWRNFRTLQFFAGATPQEVLQHFDKLNVNKTE